MLLITVTVYSNSLLATLNARQRFRDDLVISFDEVSLGHISTMPSPPVHLELGLGGMLGVESSMFDVSDLQPSSLASLHTTLMTDPVGWYEDWSSRNYTTHYSAGGAGPHCCRPHVECASSRPG